MTKLLFILISQILAAAIVFFTTDGITPPKRSKQIFQPETQFFLSKKGTILALIFLFIISLSIWQEIDDQIDKKQAKSLSDSELKRRDSIALVNQNERDSIALNRLQKSKEETIKALAIYGLKYDESQKRIEKLLKDSSKTKITNIIQQNDPIIGICQPDGIILEKTDADRLNFNISVCYKYSPTNLKLSLYAVTVYNGNWRSMGKISDIISKQTGMEIDGGLTSQLIVTNRLSVDKIFFRITGTYQKRNTKDKIPFDEVLSYQISNAETGYATDKIKEDIVKFTNSLTD